MHKLLARQVRKHLGGNQLQEQYNTALLEAVDQAYQQADEDRKLLERSIELSSAELRDQNTTLQNRLQELESTQQKLARSYSLLRSTLNSTADSIVVIDNDMTVRAHNRQFAKLCKTTTDSSCVGMSASELILRIARSVTDSSGIHTRLRDLKRRPNQEFKETLRLRDGRYLELTSIPQLLNDQIVGRVFTLHDATEKHLDEETIRHQAYHDSLTGLPNRLLMNDRIRHAITLASRNQRTLTLLFMDLDHFKSVNDRLGHEVGDKLLIQVSQRLGARLRASDTICRLGGDEFTILLEDSTNKEGWKLVAADLIKRTAQPFEIDGHEVWVSASIGVSRYPADAQSAEELMRHADMAMYEAKQLGRNRYSEFSSLLSLKTDRKAAIEAQLRHAIENGELYLEYQPKYDLKTMRPVGFEALLRWQNPVLGRVPPDEFIGIAEQCGLIIAIGDWVVRAACQQLQQWQEIGFSEITLAVNLSTQQFKNATLVGDIERVLQDHAIHPAWLELEITESSVMEDVQQVTGILHTLRELGVALSIDDFGSGYSSMSYLKNLPVHYLKIDRTFVQEIADSAADRAIVASMITLGHNLGLKVVAEGLETAAGLEELQRLSCDLVQGFLLSKPVSPEVATELLFDNKATAEASRKRLRR
ncbi:MAG: putative bifunctional diguanylate cyclase/phosphodiesterase [Pseudomonadales bacterium]